MSNLVTSIQTIVYSSLVFFFYLQIINNFIANINEEKYISYLIMSFEPQFLKWDSWAKLRLKV